MQVCRTLSCALKGAERVTEEIGEALGIRVGETDKTGTFTLIEVECLGACDRAPVVMVNDGWHECQRRAMPRCKLLDGDSRSKGEAGLSGCVHQRVEESRWRWTQSSPAGPRAGSYTLDSYLNSRAAIEGCARPWG